MSSGDQSAETVLSMPCTQALSCYSVPSPSLHCQVYAAPNPGKFKYSQYSVYWGEAMKSIPVVLRNLGSDFLELILKYLQLRGVGVVRHCR